MTRDDTWFGIRDGADRATVDAVHRGVLRAQRLRIADLTIDLAAGPWPSEVQWAVDDAVERATRTRGFFGRTWVRRARDIDLDLRDERDFEIALALVPYTIGSTGIDHHGRMIWDANDAGTSAAFQLTPSEVGEARAYVDCADGDPTALVPLDRVEDIYN